MNHLLLSSVDRTRLWRLSLGVCGLSLTLGLWPVSAAEKDLLERFFSDVQTLRADFQQTVLDEELSPIRQSEGQFWLSRPGRFRWSYGVPLEQVVLADGARIWIYDVELEQVVVRLQESGLSGTPAALLAGGEGPDESYLVEGLGTQGGISWIALFPRDSGTPFSQIQLGFEGETLRLVQMLDQLDQVTRLRFDNVVVNENVPLEHFTLALPEGVDVVREDF